MANDLYCRYLRKISHKSVKFSGSKISNFQLFFEFFGFLLEITAYKEEKSTQNFFFKIFSSIFAIFLVFRRETNVLDQKISLVGNF